MVVGDWCFALRQPACRRLVAKVAGVHRVHALKVIQVCKVHRSLYNMVQAAAGSFKDCRKIAEHLMRLLFNRAGVEYSRCRVEGNLTGGEHQLPAAHALRVWPQCLGGSIG